MPVTINGTTGIAGPDGSASTPAVQGTDSNTGLFYPAADTVALSTGGSERMRIDSSGNVGIGTSSPQTLLQVSSLTPIISLRESDGAADEKAFDFRVNSKDFSIRSVNDAYNAANTVMAVTRSTGIDIDNVRFFTGAGTERMRITSGGNLLVGTTSTSLASATTGTGLQYIPNNAVIVAANGGNSCLIANKTDSTTGSTAIFRYNGSTVGDISITSTNAFYNTASSSTNGAQLNYQGITFPATQSASSDANTLDDYEEGTFTPTLSASATAPTVSTYTTRTGRYIKIGSLVTCFIHIYCNISNAGSGYPIITGLPFTIATNADSGVSLGRWSAINSVVPVQAIVLTDGIYFESSSYVTGNNLYFNFSATYRV